MHELQALGVALVELPETQLRSMALADDLLEAVLEAKRIKSHEARRRQMQYIGRLIRDIDPGAIRSRLGVIAGSSAQASTAHRRLETLRERLLSDDAALTDVAAEHPGAAVQPVRTLLRKSRTRGQEGTRTASRDVPPDATLTIADKVMPDLGEQMRSLSLKFVPTAILSPQVAVVRKQALIINLPGQPKSIRETLQGLPDAPGIFAAVPY